jgi:hypothetical protein
MHMLTNYDKITQVIPSYGTVVKREKSKYKYK